MHPITRLGLAAALAVPTAASFAQAPGAVPAAGDRGVAIADAAVPRPAGTSCVVSLYADVAFDAHGDPTSRAAAPHPWRYAPPAQCPGPWAKVVLEADFSVNAGRQYDRTASLWLQGVNLYFGSTQEPGAKVAPRWHVERDLSDYASLFRRAGEGQTVLNNWVDAKYTGVIRGSARLLFYPAAAGDAATPPADLVVGLVGDRDGHPVEVQDEQATLARTITLPRNAERVVLDLIAQSQAVDEQWFMCIDDADLEPTREFALGPPNAGQPLEQCGNGNYREVAVSIDGQPAGRAPVYPWIYTGGVDPHLWRPTPGIQTLNFVPYRMDLTPFAGLLDDGKPHAVAMRVLGAHDFFNLAGNLLVWRDHGRDVLSGSVTQNTLATQQTRLQPRITRHFEHGAKGTRHGAVDTLQDSDYVIAGELQTSHGKLLTRVEHRSSFANRQQFEHPDATSYRQVIDQRTQTTDTVSTSSGGKTVQRQHRLDYPLRIAVDKQVHAGGDFTADIALQQGYRSERQHQDGARMVFWSKLDNRLASHSNTDFNAGGTAITGSRDQHGEQSWRFDDALGSCYQRRVQTRDETVLAVDSGQGCPNQANHLDGRSRY